MELLLSKTLLPHDSHDPERAAGASGDFHREGDDPGSGLRHFFEIGQVLQAWHLRSQRDLVDDEIGRRAIVDGCGVQPERSDLSLTDEELGGLLAVRREMEMRSIARRVVSEVSLSVRP